MVVVAAAALLAGGAAVYATAGSPAAAPASPRTVMRLAADEVRQINSFTATFGVTEGGQAGVTMSGTFAEQIRPSQLADWKVSTLAPSGLGASLDMRQGFEVIVTPGATYLTGMLTEPGKWLKVPSAAAGSFGSDPLLQQAQGGDLQLQTELLQGSADVHKVGTGTVAGIPVTEYAGTYSLVKALTSLPASDRAAFEKALPGGTAPVSFRVWMDSQQVVRKLIVIQRGSGSQAAVTLTYQVTSVNQPVHITPPPAADITSPPLPSLPSGFPSSMPIPSGFASELPSMFPSMFPTSMPGGSFPTSMPGGS